jgi:hypothetical protein
MIAVWYIIPLIICAALGYGAGMWDAHGYYMDDE